LAQPLCVLSAGRREQIIARGDNPGKIVFHKNFNPGGVTEKYA
jgi:hypothetical protein